MHKALLGLNLVLSLVTGVCALAVEKGASRLDTPAVRTGSYVSSASVNQLLGEVSAERYKRMLPVDQPINWEVYVPPAYSPDAPPGVFVFINALNSGKVPKDWQALMDKHNLIWIGANASGNNVNTQHRITYAILAPAIISREYAVDLQRVYIAGISGGGRVASRVAPLFAKRFKGAIYIIGANAWTKKVAAENMHLIKDNRYVFLTGSKDYNLQDMQRVHRQYKTAGIERLNLIVVPHMGHKRPSAKSLEEAIMFLDANLLAAPYSER
jgi:hypothetical protein